MSEAVVPFRVEVPDAELADLRERLARTRWPEPEPVDGWSQGVPLDYLRDLCDHWARRYDWRRVEARLNALPQFRTELDGLGIHLVHVRSPEPDALPLVVTNGWPGSIVEYLDVIGPLTDPAAHGGDPADAVHLVLPTLPGYGFSDKPTRPGWGVRRIAGAWARLMARLGYDRYGAVGSDWGTSITTALGQRDHEHVAGIHLVPPIAAPDPATFDDLTAAERAALAALEHAKEWEDGYSVEQSTRPQTIGYSLVDSPAGLCAWIVEKFHAWTDCAGHPENVLSRDQMLDNITLYWLTRTGASAARLYWESIRQVQRWFTAAVEDTVDVPAGCSVFPKELPRPSRRWAARRYTDIRYWNEPARGGHFAALEQPELFVDEVRSFFRLVRG
ncbi:Pimeloyl-ACP methyl ester carboxylesterase [Amycolatopsis arida]|uniref:Pimeloyl-ACP methyl ester carboxylesterase n=1 Tax=Amycolatopsis arida TaxID=587909 RepID=A0A1I5M594_9PSEU|nr:epoxide hydrolase family protein [Amycolatopsis arida]TDX93974.1 pimeloyl-ACP methyl ester carboxylesterase [Amycolatopsis arida]SFP04695.1 Pimeloyl-ACP methyl ester carboxylesterase [Amycolatopsis arida]